MSIRGRLTQRFQSRELRGASVLVASSIVAQLLTLAVTPILSRTYDAQAFGYLTMVVSTSGIIAPVASLRLESALMLPKSARDATALFTLGALATLLISLLAVGVLELLFALGYLAPMAALAGFSWWVGGITFFSGVFVLLGQFALRLRNYGAVAVRNVTQAVATLGAQLGFLLLTPSAVGLVGGHAVGRVAGVLPLVASIWSNLAGFAFVDLRRVLREYRVFPLLFAPAALMNAAALALPIIVAGIWFDVADAGQWGMAERVLAVPLVIVGAAVSQVVEARLSHHVRSESLGSARYYLKISILLLVLGALAGGVVVLAAPILIPIILGEGWTGAALIMQLLVPMLVARVIASPLSRALTVAKWARVNLLLDSVRLALVVGVLVWCEMMDVSLSVLVLSTSIMFTCIYALTWFAGLLAVRRLDRDALLVSETSEAGR